MSVAAAQRASETSGSRPWRSPAELFADRLAVGWQSVAAAVEGLHDDVHLWSGDELAAGSARLDELAGLVERARVLVVAEGLSRGLPAESGLGAHDWAAQRCPGLSRLQVADIVTVAQALGEPAHAQVAEQVRSQGMPVRRAAAVLRSLAKVKPFLDAAGYDEAMSTLLDVAGQPSFSDRDLRRVTDHLARVVLPERDHEVRAHAAREMRGVNESSLADGSLVRFVITCEPEGAAVFRAVLASPLTAPAPDETGPDLRTGTQRRYDALLTMLRRGQAGSEQMPTTAKAVVCVTMAYDVLTHQLTGTGATSFGDVLSPETVRRIACDADLVPMVLGTNREILDLGRTRRLVTPGQRRALHHRDGHCTFPGCSTPAPWCEAHHVVHWSRGGASDLGNYALLCGRHHTLVHDRGHTATVTLHGVRWHL